MIPVDDASILSSSTEALCLLDADFLRFCSKRRFAAPSGFLTLYKRSSEAQKNAKRDDLDSLLSLAFFS